MSCVSAPQARVVYAVGAPALGDALKAHLERRAKSAGRAVVSIGALSDEDPWHELALRVVGNAALSPGEAGDEIAARARGTLILLRRRASKESLWGRGLSERLASMEAPHSAGQAILVVVLSDVLSAVPNGARVIELSAKLSGESAKRVWDGLFAEAEQGGAPAFGRLDALEGWWRRARLVTAAPPSPVPLSDAAGGLYRRILLARRALPLESVLRLGSVEAYEELLQRGVLALDAEGRVVEGAAELPVSSGDDAHPEDALSVAGVLRALPGADGWAMIRACELFARARRLDEAEVVLAQALSRVNDAEARSDLWRRWTAALKSSAEHEKPKAKERLLRTVEIALRIGDAENALEAASMAIGEYGETHETALWLGKALLARGELLAALVPLHKALDYAGHAEAAAQAAVALSEAHYMAGDYTEARRYAERALSLAVRGKTRLSASNLVGKLYLAAEDWKQAELHFTQDASEALCSGDFVGELRAHLNRGVALSSANRWREAREIFEMVRKRAQDRDEFPATAFALTNLAMIAIFERDYENAIQWSEASVEAVRRTGDRVRLSLMIANLAELRANLGLLDEAEQTLMFGRRVNGTAMVPARIVHFALIAARIHLSRGDTKRAQAELTSAFACAQGGGGKNKLGECYRVAARVALEIGDLERMREMVEKAKAIAANPYARAEVALLFALLERGLGKPCMEAARHALSLAAEMPFNELLLEANVLACHAALAAGNEASARSFLCDAIRSRDASASCLNPELRMRFLARRELSGLAELEKRFRAAAGAGQDDNTPVWVGMPEDTGAQGGDVLPDQSDRSGQEGTPTLRAGTARRERVQHKLVGRAPAMTALFKAIQKVGPSEATVLIHGESGTGKELCAEAIHEASARRGGPLVKVNCAALVESLLLSELFGHEKGSFTGAGAKRRGRFELAEKGTLFLDEIGDISPRTQVALLRVLHSKTFERVGGVASLQADVRIVCATHRDLKAMVQRGEFREDLYYRLCGVVLEVPPLRNRMADLPLIAGELLLDIARERREPPKALSPCALELLASYVWPGNVRELSNALGAACVFADGDVLTAGDFAAAVGALGALAAAAKPNERVDCTQAADDEPDDDFSSLDLAPSGVSGAGPSASDVAYARVRSGVGLSDLKRAIERDCIARALAESGGNITRAAALLGMKRPRLSQLVKHYRFSGCSEE